MELGKCILLKLLLSCIEDGWQFCQYYHWLEIFAKVHVVCLSFNIYHSFFYSSSLSPVNMCRLYIFCQHLTSSCICMYKVHVKRHNIFIEDDFDLDT